MGNYSRHSRFTEAEIFFKELTHDNKTFLFPWRKYYITVPLNHGLARQTQALPPDVPVTMRFHRASSFCLLIKATETVTATEKGTQNTEEVPFTYPETVIPIVNPILSAFMAYSNEMDRAHSRNQIYSTKISYLDYQARRSVLAGGLTEFNITLSHSKFPKYLFLGLSNLERLAGSETLSCMVKN